MYIYVYIYIYMLLSVWYYQPRFKKVPIVNVDMNLIPTPEQLLKATVAIRPHQIKKNRLVSWDGLIALKPSSKVVHLLACLEICLHHEIGTPWILEANPWTEPLSRLNILMVLLLRGKQPSHTQIYPKKKDVGCFSIFWVAFPQHIQQN